MRRIIPFIHTLPGEEEAKWTAAIERLSPDVLLRPPALLSEAERAAARIAVVANPDPADLRGLPSLVWVHSLWAGVEKLAPYMPDHVAIVRMTDPQLAATMAEAVLAWTLYLHRDMPRYAAQQRARTWRQHETRRAQERTVGVLGLGHMGATAARRLAANDFHVIGWSRTPKIVAGVETFDGADGLAAVLARADILVLLLPLTDATRGLIGAGALASMKVGAALINFGRGALVDDEALLARLDAGALDHAVLDVFATEPLPPESPFWAHPRATVLPHISATTNVATASRIVADNLRSYFRDGTIPPAVDRRAGY
ncbi:MAG TPA: glyoxylate/hydroxypyruvate reductase A [Rhodoblastus sp.]|nr:glyoxylate/hydroxypyruvate reductase A [Rhodoblastus sp.]